MACWQAKIKPNPAFPEAAQQSLAGLASWASQNEAGNAAVLEDDSVRGLIAGLAGNAPYLAQLIQREPAFTLDLFEKGPDAAMAGLFHDITSAAADASGTDELMRVLRLGKGRLALLTAAADVGGAWSLKMVTEWLSMYADMALDYTIAHLLHQAMTKGDLDWPGGEEESPTPSLSTDCGYVIVALGKLGGNELNYSSDIDLIALFDTEKVNYKGRRNIGDFFVRLTQDLVQIISKRTHDGYVFRTDFRLRPDPGATPLAISLNAADVYYQSIGQNWERSAMIKARPVAGDKLVGQDFIERMHPFVWRRNLDFAAIADIHSIKTRTHDHHQHTSMAVNGQDIKIGHGGIREIEFLAQIQQLIFGGREPHFRVRATLDALAAINELGRLSDKALHQLTEAYKFLRTLEHRLQMIHDEQTHRIPDSDQDIANLAMFMGFDTAQEFRTTLMNHMKIVKRHFTELSGDHEARGLRERLTGETLDSYLKEHDFTGNKSALEIIDRWRSGRYRALRTERSRRLLEVCLGDLIKAFANTSNPDKSLARFDSFLSKLPTGVQLFSMFQANHWLFRLLATIMGTAPQLADQLARKPVLLDTVLSIGFFDDFPSKRQLSEDLEQHLNQASDYQDTLDAARRWLGDKRFEIGVHMMEQLEDISESSRLLTYLADIMIAAMIPAVSRDFEKRYGTFAEGELAVVALGSYGGCELSYTSDLDIIFLYDVADPKAVSSGPKQLGSNQYFARLSQHVITAISAMTAEGRLYELDMRLRPSGRAGPLVVTLGAFEDYQLGEAWAWEHMALSRARIVYGSEDFSNRISKSINEVLAQKRESDDLVVAVDEMRRKIEKEFGTGNIWDIRNIRGGIVDIEFITQFLLLMSGQDHPDIFETSLQNSLSNLATVGALNKKDCWTLKKAYYLQQTLQGTLRLCHGKDLNEDEFSVELRTLLAKRGEAKTFAALKKNLQKQQSQAFALFNKLIADKASKLNAVQKSKGT
jgi:[glutamine synthetase] adenylyltransferase / [glutamine synthetase]-adenylyl-L-tyrosine phosphorylase